jgi:anti-sigma B factor antagonist
MEIKMEPKGQQITTIRVAGRLDATTSPEFERQVAGCLEQGVTGLILSFAELDYISSAGLRVLIFAAKKLKSGSGALALCGLRDHVKEVLEIAGFFSILHVLPTEDEAVAWVSRQLAEAGAGA